MDTEDREHDIAIVGMSGRFPGARDTAEYWRNLCAGVESIRIFDEEALIANGTPVETLREPGFVPAHGALDEAYAFDAAFFGVTPSEARVMDPQQRVFLQCAWSALEDAGYDPRRAAGPIGVFAGAGSNGHHARVLRHPELVAAVGANVAEVANSKDFLATRTSYKLALRGPSLTIQTACSTSLVAIHVACQSLLARECDMALAGGVTIAADQVRGYRHEAGGIQSPDGHCRAFDARAAGTVCGSGAGVVLLKRLTDALRDGDTIHAVVKGSAINNDGDGKIGFTAPSQAGQARVVAEAMALAGVEPATVSYIEAHGTGTALGDPIEVAALTDVFRASTARIGICALGAVKTNIGHLDCAAGVAGFIKAVLALKHGQLPPTLHFEQPNPELALDRSPFFVNTTLRPWPRNGQPRRAGVSSFGIGGTNAHVVLEEAPALTEPDAQAPEAAQVDGPALIVLSAKSEPALQRLRANLAAHLGEDVSPPALHDLAGTLQEGRAAHVYRWAAAARDTDDLRARLCDHERRRSAARQTASRETTAARAAAQRQPSIAFLFPGQGTQYPGMARAIYLAQPVFRDTVDRCAAVLAPVIDADLRVLLWPVDRDAAEAHEMLRRTRITQPALFTVEYALATLWMSWGVQPAAMLGHSIGEYVAATLAGVFGLDAALRLVAARAVLMEGLPEGAMLAVPLPEAELASLLADDVAIAAVNGPASCVASGTSAAIEALQARLAARQLPVQRLRTSHAFHSAAVDPMLAAFEEEVRRARPAAPARPFMSNVTGDWITADEATDPAYWARHLRSTVRFADGVGRLLADEHQLLLEVGPGDTLAQLARRMVAGGHRVLVSSVPAARDAASSDASDLTLLDAAGALWTAGADLDWSALRGGAAFRRVPLPTYPFDRTEYRVPPPIITPNVPATTPSTTTPDTSPGATPTTMPTMTPTAPPLAPISSRAASSAAAAAPPMTAAAMAITPLISLGSSRTAPSATVVDASAAPTALVTAVPASAAPTPVPSRAPGAAVSHTTDRVATLFGRLLGIEPARLERDETFLEQGADSLLLMQASRTIEQTFGIRVPFRQLIDGLSSITRLADHLDREAPPFVEPAAAATLAPSVRGEDVTITSTAPSATLPPAALPNGPSASAASRAAALAGAGLPDAAPTIADAPSAAPTMAAPATAMPPNALPEAASPGLRQIVAHQLAIMQEQLALLRTAPAATAAPVAAAAPVAVAGAGAVETLAAAASAAAVGALAGSGVPAAAAIVAPDARAIADAAASTAGAMVPTASPGPPPTIAIAAAPATVAIAGQASPLPLVSTGEAPTDSHAHGPHRPVRETMGQGRELTPLQASHFDALVARYTARTRGSKAYAAAHRAVLADNRASLNFRRATKELLYPIVGVRSDGTRLWDADDNEYVDFTLGFGVHFFGHRPAFIAEAVEAQLRRGLHLGPQSDLAGPVAQLFRELTGMERVTFCNTGSEAIMTALRIARAATGRDRIVTFEGSYHGAFDGILARRAPGGAEGVPRSRPVAPGTPQGMVDDVTVLPYGAPASLAWIEAHASELAAVLVEPVQLRQPDRQPREFLAALRAATARAGTVLIFDEMVTGFRLHPRGAQGWYGIDADLATYGKVIGGGFPLGVVAGRAALMDAIDGGDWRFGDESYPAANQTFFAGTFCKHPLAMAAAQAVLRHLIDLGPSLQADLNARTDRLVAALRQEIAAIGARITVVHCGSFFLFRFDARDRFGDLLFFHMVARGIYIWEGRACFVSTAHTDQDCDRFVHAFRESLHAMRAGGFLETEAPAVIAAVAAAAVSAPALAATPVPPREAASAPPIGPFPLTQAQRQVWVHAQLGADASRAYHEQIAFALRGPVDTAMLRAALTDVMQHHDALRAIFERDGETQRITPDLEALVTIEPRLASADPADGPADEACALARAAKAPFDLATGPLVRLHVHPAGHDRHILQLIVHHIVCDGIGLGLLVRDFEAACAARRRGEAPVLAPAMSFRDYAAHLSSEASVPAEAEAAWLARFADAQPLDLATDRPRPIVPAHRADTTVLTLPGELVTRLRRAGGRRGRTLLMSLLGGLLKTLHTLAGQADIVVGIPSAGRAFPGAETVIGHCVDVLPIRSRLAPDTRLFAFLDQVRQSLLQAYEHEALSWARLSESLTIPRGPGLTPLLAVTLNLEPGRANASAEPPRFAGLDTEAVTAQGGFAKFDIAIDAVDRGDDIRLSCVFNADLFARETIDRLLHAMMQALRAIATDEDRELASVSLLDEAEQARVLQAWNDTAMPFPAARRLHELFEAQAAARPEAIAIRCGAAEMAYGELDARANQLAHRLVQLGVGPDARVAIALERRIELVVALLAVLKAGGAYVPIDPRYPAERIAFMLADSAARVLVTETAVRATLPALSSNEDGEDAEDAEDGVGGGVRTLCLDDEIDAAAIARESASRPITAGAPEALAYVIYTSGSTGRPKGVAIPHRAAVAFLSWAATIFTPEELSGVLASTSICFDLSIFELFLPLSRGGRIILVDQILALHDAPAVDEVRLVNTVPSAIAALLAGRGLPSGVRTVNLAGEALRADLVDALHDRGIARVFDLYGPSEDTTYSTFARRTPGGPEIIGRPIANTRAYIVDSTDAPVPIGVAGELLLGGAGLARGYLDRPGLTASRFVPDPFSGVGGRLYRTGDRARWRDDGTLVYLGRLDDQVKLRGFRIEPGESEALLRSRSDVAECRVIVREDQPGEKRLVAYVACRAAAGADLTNAAADGETAALVRELHAFLHERLPEFACPSAIVPLAALPLTPNGKVDVKALPAPDARAGIDRAPAPRTLVEQLLAGIWCDVLGLDEVGTTDSFFALGGHSLLATRVIARVREALGVELPFRTFFERPTLAAAAQAIDALRAGAFAPDAAITARPRVEPLPMSFAQERLWFLDRLQPGGTQYSVPAAWRVEGPLDAAILERALDDLLTRHESLRTTLAEQDGRPVQIIAAPGRFTLPIEDYSALDETQRVALVRERMAAEAATPFDLVAGPLTRVCLLRLAAEDHLLLVTCHHAIIDAWSLDILVRDLVALYEARRNGAVAQLPPLPVQYADHAAWQREQLAKQLAEHEAAPSGEALVSDRLAEQIAYWRQQLDGAPPVLELPTDRPRPFEPSFAGACLTSRLSRDTVRQLRQLGRREGATLHMVCLALFQLQLSKLAGVTDLVIGTPVAGRTREEVANLIGLFVNTLALRGDLSGDPSVREIVRRVRATALAAYDHQDAPFDKVVEAVQPRRSGSQAPLFQVMFALQEAAPAGSASGLRLTPAGADVTTSKVDLLLDVRPDDEGAALLLTYSRALFEPATVERLLAQFTRLAEQAAQQPDRRGSDLSLLSDTERTQLVSVWNDTDRRYPRTSTIAARFAAQVLAHPQAPALEWGDRSWSYAAFDARTNQLARLLRARGVGAEQRVGVLLPRGADLILVLMAIVKAGGAYVPLDAEYPRERLAWMCADADLALVISARAQLARLGVDTHARAGDLTLAGGTPVLCLDDEADLTAAQPSTAVDSGATPHSLAYIVYTSGSTGRPKGVMVEQRHILQLVCETDYVSLGPGDRVAQASNTAFDALAFEMWGALLNGATLVGLERERLLSPVALRAALRDARIDTIYQTTALLNGLVREQPDIFAGVRDVLFGGQASDAVSVRRLLQAGGPARLVHVYGPTETTAWCSWCRVDAVADDARTVSVGGPTGNARIYLLDRAGQPVPIGVTAEAYVGGAGIVRGYLGRPGLTAERFVPDPFGEPGARLYRTGDRLRRLPDGSLEFVGRTDDQVKIRGFRIEPGEVEHLLCAHPDVREARAIVRQDGGEPQLVAYVAGAVEESAIEAYMRQSLPDYMVPSAILSVDRLPMTPNGKLDVAALPSPADIRDRAREDEAATAPRTPVEEMIAAIWADVLRCERVGRDEGFFALGGHSLLAMRVVSRIRELLGVELPLRLLFDEPTVSALAEEVEARRRADRPAAPPATRAADAESWPLSFAQERLWFLERLQPGSARYHIPIALRLTGALDTAALTRALATVVQRHEVLRSRFAAVDGVPRQTIGPFLPVDADLLPIEQLTASAGETLEEALRRRAREEASQPFALGTDRPFRARLLRLDERAHVLLITMHHIVSDGWSVRILHRELFALYDAYRRDRAVTQPPPSTRSQAELLPPEPWLPESSRPELTLPELPIQYTDYAVWQRDQLQGAALDTQLAYWRGQLQGVPPLHGLPTDRPRPAMQAGRGGIEPIHLPPAHLQRLRALGRAEGATLYMVLLAAFQLLLARYAATDDIVVGSPIAGRARREVEDLIGFFVNTLALRTDLSGNPSVRTLLRRVREVTLGAYEHQDVPFERLVKELVPERSLAHAPLVQLLFTLQMEESGGTQEAIGGLRVEQTGVPIGVVKFDLELWLAVTRDGVMGGLQYDADLFEPATVRRFARHFARVLERMAEDPDCRIADLELTDADEQAAMLGELHRDALPPPSAMLTHDAIAAQARRTPNEVAVVGEDGPLTYAELEARANALAQRLVAAGASPDVPVALLLERNAALLVALLGILKAGAPYLPLDPSSPADRLAFMLEDAGATIVLTQRSLRATLPTEASRRVLLIDDVEAASGPAVPPATAATPAHAAYVIYTSGSTGRPKGVQISHANVVSLFAAMDRELGHSAPGTYLAVTRVSFDVHVTELLWPLTRGFRVVIHPDIQRSTGEHALTTAIRRHGVTHFQGTPSLIRLLLAEEGEQALQGIGYLLVTGEELPRDLATQIRRAFSGCFYNLYGPTEAAVWATGHRMEAEPGAGSVSIGRAIANTRVYVTDASLRPLPPGVPGDLYIGGQGVARGYVRRPSLTAHAFIPDPFSGEPGARLYRTGDRARWRADGTLEFLGRADAQIKIRGLRIEPGEIEAALRQHPQVQDAVVIVREDQPGDRRLIGYMVGTADAESVRASLRQTLPEYMVPAAFVSMEALPLTPSGKVNRGALPAPPVSRRAEGVVGPRNFLEAQLIQIWEELLGVEVRDPHESFFELGGDSLLALRLASQVERRFRCELPVAAMFAGASLRQMAEAIQALRRSDARPSTIVPMQVSGQQPPLFCVHPADRRVLGYVSLVRHLGTERPVFGFQDLGEDFSRPIPRMAAEYVAALRERWPHGPYRLLGWSFGGYVAYEMAHQLEQLGESVAFVGLLDTIEAVRSRGWMEDEVTLLIGVGQDITLQAGLRTLAIDRETLDACAPADRLARLLDALHAQGLSPAFDLPALRAYHDTIQGRIPPIYAYAAPPIAAPVTLFRAEVNEIDRDPFFAPWSVEEKRTLGWSRLLRGMEVRHVPGTHATIAAEPHVRVLAAELRESLGAADLRETAGVWSEVDLAEQAS